MSIENVGLGPEAGEEEKEACSCGGGREDSQAKTTPAADKGHDEAVVQGKGPLLKDADSVPTHLG